MEKKKEKGVLEGVKSIEDCLLHAQELVPLAVSNAKGVKGFVSRWKMIMLRLDQIPRNLSDLSSHPCFSKNVLFSEQLQAVSSTLKESIELAELCINESYKGKLRMQNDLDSLMGKLDLNLKDCGLLIKTGVLGEVTLPLSRTGTMERTDIVISGNIRELLARLQIGQLEAKHRALDGLVEAMKNEESSVLTVMGRSNVASLVHLLTATSPVIREKTVSLICSLVESGCCEKWLVSEGVLSPLIRLLESGSALGKEKATISLQRLSLSSETSRAIAGHGGIPPLIEICHSSSDSVLQEAAACALKNLSAVPEVRQSLVDEGIVKVMTNLLGHGIQLGSKEYAAECLRNLTSNDKLRISVVSGGGVESLLAYLDGPLPQESAACALRNLVNSVSVQKLVAMGFLPCLVHVLQAGSLGAQQAAASAICKVCSSLEMKKLIGEAGCIPLLIKLLEGNSNNVKEGSAQAIANLITHPLNCKEVKRNDRSIPNLVQLLDPYPQNCSKKYAVSCLILLSHSRKRKKLMISYGAIGYLKKLTEMDIPGSKKLLDRLERGRLKSLFIRK